MTSVNDRIRAEDDSIVPRITLKFSFYDVNVTRMQIAVRVAIVGIVHKAQGQRLKKALIDLRPPYFSPGHFNCARYRVRKCSDLILLHKRRDIPRTWSMVNMIQGYWRSYRPPLKLTVVKARHSVIVLNFILQWVRFLVLYGGGMHGFPYKEKPILVYPLIDL